MMRVKVKPELLRWALERAGRSVASLRKNFPRIDLWERGEATPTFKQLEAFAEAVFVPVGYLFLTKSSGTYAIGDKEFFGTRRNKVHRTRDRKREANS